MSWIQRSTIFAAIVELRIVRETLIDYAKNCSSFVALFGYIRVKVYKLLLTGNYTCLTLRQYFDIVLQAIKSYSKPTTQEEVFQLDPDKFRGHDKVKSMIEDANKQSARVRKVNLESMLDEYLLEAELLCFEKIEENLENYFTKNFARELIRELNLKRGEYPKGVGDSQSRDTGQNQAGQNRDPKDVGDSQSNPLITTNRLKNEIKNEIKNSPSNPLRVMFDSGVSLVVKLLVVIVASVFDRRGPEKYGKKIVGCKAFKHCKKKKNCVDLILLYVFSYILVLLLCPECSDFYIEFIDNPKQGLAYKFNDLIKLVWTAMRDLTVEIYFPHKTGEVKRKYVICIRKDEFKSLEIAFPRKEEIPFTEECLFNKDKSEGEDEGGGKSEGMGKGEDRDKSEEKVVKSKKKRYSKQPENDTEISVGGIAEVEEADKYSKIPDENSNLNEDEMGDEE